MGMQPFRTAKDIVSMLANRPDLSGLTQVSKARWSLNLACHCETPVVVERTGRRIDGRDAAELISWPHYEPAQRRSVGNATLLLDMEVPCRQCASCRRARAAHWRKRAFIEVARWPRTWFATFTLTDQAQWEATMRGRVLATRSNRDWDQLEADEQFRLRVRALTPELTRHWKRLRKNSQAPLRYMWVAENASQGERREVGNPHIHALIHERDQARPIRKSLLRGSWPLGFDSYKLVDDERQAAYVCKYIAKQIRCPVRASNGYGKELLLPSFERSEETGAKLPPEGGETLTPEGRASKEYSLAETFDFSTFG